MSTEQFDSTTDHHTFDEGSLQQHIGLPLRCLGFWTAVITPFVLLGLLSLGIAQQSPLLVGGLLAANVSGLVIGRDYNN